MWIGESNDRDSKDRKACVAAQVLCHWKQRIRPCLGVHKPHDRRKFRSQTSDKMDRWKSRGGKSQRRERQKKDDQVRKKVDKS